MDCYSTNSDRRISCWSTTIKSGPATKTLLAVAYYNRGTEYFSRGDYDSAILDYYDAIQLWPGYFSAYDRRGRAYSKKGEHDRAIANYDKAIEISPHYAIAYYDRGSEYENKGQFEKALADFRQALSNIPPSDTEMSSDAQKRISQIEQKIAAAANVHATTQTTDAQSTQPQSIRPISRRVALVIGNSAYEFAPELRNPRNDAEAMNRMLSGMGFEVISGIDLKKPELEAKIVEFAKATKTADLSLFFYAGHGLQVAGQNYLVPIEAKVDDDTALNFELVNAGVVTNYMGGDNKVGIVLLDACRDNPFTRSLKRSLGATRAESVSQGLAAISSEGGGLVIGYATAPGDVAADGDGINSPFTTALLNRLPSKGLELELVLKRVKADVIEATRNEQCPWTNSDLSTEVYLQHVRRQII